MDLLECFFQILQFFIPILVFYLVENGMPPFLIPKNHLYEYLLKEILQYVLNKIIMKVLPGLVNAIMKVFTPSVNAIKKVFTQWENAITEFFTWSVNAIKKVFTRSVNASQEHHQRLLPLVTQDI